MATISFKINHHEYSDNSGHDNRRLEFLCICHKLSKVKVLTDDRTQANFHRKDSYELCDLRNI